MEHQSQLEATILRMANDKLALLRSYATEPATAENKTSFFGVWRELCVFAELGLIADSGLTQPGAATLQEIDKANMETWSQYVEANGIGAAKH